MEQTEVIKPLSVVWKGLRQTAKYYNSAFQPFEIYLGSKNVAKEENQIQGPQTLNFREKLFSACIKHLQF